MKMNWQENFNEKLVIDKEVKCADGTWNAEIVQHFIKTEIIEKLIADIPDSAWINTGIPEAGKLYIGTELKQQLKDKWI